MPTININVKNKIADVADGSVIVCGNSDYVVNFSFDEEWDGQPAKTARFRWNGKYEDVLFEGTQCPAPVITNTEYVEIGVYFGDLCTTTSAFVPALKSILCADGTHEDPPEDVYNQLIKLLNSAGVYGCGIKRVESLDTENIVNLRDLESGTYILYGYFRPFAGSDTVLTFPNNLAVGIVTKTAGTHVQIPYPVNNCIQFLEITDESYERKDVYLNDYEIHVTKAEDGTYTTDAEFSDVVYNHNRGRRVVFYVDDLNGAELMAENFTDTIISAAAIYNQDGAQYTATVEFNADNTVTVYIKSCEEEINKLSKEIDKVSKDVSLGITGATVGQTVKITEVDENGKPVKWEDVEMANGGTSDAVQYVPQELTDEQQMQARVNLGLYWKEYVNKVLASIKTEYRKTDISDGEYIFDASVATIKYSDWETEGAEYQLERQSSKNSSMAGTFHNVSWFGNGNLIKNDTDLYETVADIEETKYTDVPFVLYEYISDFTSLRRVYRLYIDDAKPSFPLTLGVYLDIIDTENFDEVYHPVPQEYIPVLDEIVLNSSDESGRQFRITVDDNGALSATEITE